MYLRDERLIEIKSWAEIKKNTHTDSSIVQEKCEDNDVAPTIEKKLIDVVT